MLLAPQNEKLRELESEDPTLAGRIRKAFDLARKRGYKRHVFVELKDGRYVHLESLNADQTTTKEETEEAKKKPRLLTSTKAFLSYIGLGI